MKGIFRLTQSRPAQILPKSELNSFGLYPYSDHKNTDFFKGIKYSNSKIVIVHHSYAFFEEPIEIHLIIRKLNQWIKEQLKPNKFKSKITLNT